MPLSEFDGRFALITEEVESTEDSFAADVSEGFSSSPKRLSCRFFYDGEGSKLFDDITKLPEYYLTSAGVEILASRADEIASVFEDEVTLVELGSGSAVKTQHLIDALLERQDRLRFVPVDISAEVIEASSPSLLRSYPGLEVLGVAAEYRAGLKKIRELEGPRLILWLGSNVGNFERKEAARFLGHIGEQMTDRDRLLMGVDLRKDRSVLEAAYDDSQGVTARFNLNLLERINKELGGQFEVDRFRHRAVYNEDVGRVEMYLGSTCAQTVRIEDLDLDVPFEKGEEIHTENSYKYSLDEIDTLADAARMQIERRWLDTRGLFSKNLLKIRNAR